MTRDMPSSSASVVPARRRGTAPLLSGLRESMLGSVLIAALSVAALLGLWEAAALYWKVPTWLVPRPSDFLARLFTDAGMIAGHALATSRTILTGFAIGVAIAVPLAMLITSILRCGAASIR